MFKVAVSGNKNFTAFLFVLFPHTALCDSPTKAQVCLHTIPCPFSRKENCMSSKALFVSEKITISDNSKSVFSNGCKCKKPYFLSSMALSDSVSRLSPGQISSEDPKNSALLSSATIFSKTSSSCANT